LEKEAEEEEI
jgi:hypothetical protein